MNENEGRDEDECAVGVNFDGGSCISIDILEDMIHTYNKSKIGSLDKIDMTSVSKMKDANPITYKSTIVNLLAEKLKKYACKKQSCWMNLPFFRALSTPENTKKLHKQTFKPHGPRNTNEWLNTYNINEIFAQYQRIYPDFRFLGAQPRDFDMVTLIPKLNIDELFTKYGITKYGIIFNLDKSNQSGSHWVSLFADLAKGQIYYIDSVGQKPLKEFVAFMDRLESISRRGGVNSIDRRYSNVQHQHGGSECGVYSISFILRFLDGETFDGIAAKHVSDEEIKLCRKRYFRK